MIETLRALSHLAAIGLFGFSAGAAWIAAIAAPNTSYDRLDATRADGHVRALLRNASIHVAVTLVLGAGLALFAHLTVAATIGAIAAVGFLSNLLTLGSPRKGRSPVRRVVAVSLTLVFTLVALVAAGVAIAGL